MYISTTGIGEKLCGCCRAPFCCFLTMQTDENFRNGSRSPFLVL